MNLSQTTKGVLYRIQKAEQEKRYNDHVDDPYSAEYYPIDETYSYQKPWYIQVGYTLLKKLIILPYEWVVNHYWFHTKVIGIKHIKEIPAGAILTCNHINKLDSLVVGHAIKKKKIHYTTAEFNNLKCRLGTYMRAYGIFPIPTKKTGILKFQAQVEAYLKQKDWILFFPECAEWWCYEAPRPYQMGAFHYASKYNVPILPMFITFVKTKKYDKEGICKRHFVLHFLKPIFPKPNLSFQENKKVMKEENERLIWECYKKFYF